MCIRDRVAARHIGLDRGRALTAGAEQHGGVQLLRGGIQVQQQLQHLVDDLVHPLVGAVDLVDHHDCLLYTSGKVVKYRKNMTLEPMNAYERHVIHAALQDYPNVTTYSTGVEPNRRTVVAYAPGQK